MLKRSEHNFAPQCIHACEHTNMQLRPFFAAPEITTSAQPTTITLPTPSASTVACKDWCLSNSQPWSIKCTWSDRCAGCPYCSGMALVDCACDLFLIWGHLRIQCRGTKPAAKKGLRICVCVCVCACVSVCLCVYACVWMHVCGCLCVCVCVDACVWMHMCVPGWLYGYQCMYGCAYERSKIGGFS